MTSLRVVYRAAPALNRKRRPDWFSKWLCLGSLLRGVARCDPTSIDLRFLCDGELPEPVLAAMTQFGKVESLDHLGNSRSFLHAVERAADAELEPEAGVYLVEDDYLHLPDALVHLQDGLGDASPGSYFTLYDHPDRYQRTDDLRPRGRPVELLGGRHWRRVESTNMTFATTLGTLRRDRIPLWCSARFTSYPHDRALWRSLQALGARRPLEWVRGGRSLLGAVPALATHCEVGMLAPAVDWSALAEDTHRWMAEVGLDDRVDW